MNDNRGQRRGVIILATVGVLLMLVVLSWGFMSWREEQLAARPTTPELVLQAFRDADYQVDDIQVVQARGNIAPLFGSPERFIEFNARAGSQGDFIFVRVVQYGSKEQAEESAKAINELNERMNGSFAYAYYRGAILMAVNAKSDRIASEFKGVFRSAAEP